MANRAPELADALKRDVGASVFPNACRIQRVVTLAYKDSRDSRLPCFLDRGENVDLIVDHHVMIRREPGFHVGKLTLLVDVKQDVAPEPVVQPCPIDFARLKHDVSIGIVSLPSSIRIRLFMQRGSKTRRSQRTPLTRQLEISRSEIIPCMTAITVEAHLTQSIHDFFLAKCLDVVRPGGVIAVITSRYTMDKQDPTVRRHLSNGSDLLGAVRLPNTAFKANAGTEVTTDILFLQKRSPEKPAQRESWLDLTSVDTADGPVQINEYFARHPEMMLGRMGMESRQYGAAPALIGTLEPGALERAGSVLPAGVYRNGEQKERVVDVVSVQVPAPAEVKEGGLTERDGQLVIRRGDTFQPLAVPGSVGARIRGMIQVRGAVREVFRTQLSDAPDQDIAEARRHLNRTYDSFVSRFGPLNAKENVKAFARDPDQPLLQSLEEFNPETKQATKTAVFDRRTLERYRPVERTETAPEALLVSLNETGQITWPRMESLTGKPASELQAELGSLAYRNPESGEWETADRYLSGNVRSKLAVAQASAQIDPAYQRNVDALQAVQPKDLEPGEIEARLGSLWIPPSDVREFVTELLDVPRSSVKIGYAETIATWTVELDYGAKHVVNNTTTHGTARFRASELIEQSLNGRTPTAYDKQEDGSSTVNQPETIAAREKQQHLKDRFRDWVWEDRDRADRLAKEYNLRFNNLRLRDFDGSHLTLPGMVRTSLRDGDLAPHQKNAVWRILQGGSPLLAHVVGAGKTWTMAAAAMELRRLDLAKKPMFVVPNHLVDQWGAEFLKLYPQARLFVAGKDHFETGNRQQAMARIATGNYDAVIVSHRSFEFLPVSDAYFIRRSCGPEGRTLPGVPPSRP